MTLKAYIETGAHSIEELAATLGVSPHAVRKWLYGQRRISLDMALRINEVTRGAVDLESMVRERAA